MFSGSAGQANLQILGQDDDLRADGERGEAGHDERLAALAGGDQAVRVMAAELSLLRQEQRQAGHVAVGAVGILGADGQLLRVALPSSTAFLGRISRLTGLATSAGSFGAPASSQRMSVV